LRVKVMAEGSETPNGEQGPPAQGPPRRGEGDLFAERRARRAAESGELALTRRAEAAEATLQTLERHVASLQQRLREAEDEQLRLEELLEGERAAAHEREHELRRVKQREYAEQQLRVETEERLTHAAADAIALERESRGEIEQLGVRLSASEDEARALAGRLQSIQRQLAEAEQEIAAERAAVRRSEHDLQERMSELERRALEIQRGLEAERSARERSEQALAAMREGHRRIESLVGEMKGILAGATSALAVEQRPQLTRQVAQTPTGEAPASEMADALAAAVERLRARAETVEGSHVAQPQPSTPRAAHKHSMSWFERQRIKRKQRRERRGE
jgi:chromosome segregation ATPase